MKIHIHEGVKNTLVYIEGDTVHVEGSHPEESPLFCVERLRKAAEELQRQGEAIERFKKSELAATIPSFLTKYRDQLIEKEKARLAKEEAERIKEAVLHNVTGEQLQHELEAYNERNETEASLVIRFKLFTVVNPDARTLRVVFGVAGNCLKYLIEN